MMPLPPIDQTYSDVERFLRKLVFEAFRQWPFLDPDEVLSAAHLGFMSAYEKYKSKVGEFSTYVGYLVKKRIKTVLMKTAKRNARGVRSLTNEDDIAQKEIDPEMFKPRVWLRKLPKDARVTAKAALTPPIDVTLVIRQMKSEKPEAVRFAIREYLTERGWDPKRIKQAFQTVKESL